MARSLEKLLRQYKRSSPQAGPGGPGRGPGGPGRGPGMGPRKPANTKAVVSRILSYIGQYKRRLILVFACMILTSLLILRWSYRRVDR